MRAYARPGLLVSVVGSVILAAHLPQGTASADPQIVATIPVGSHPGGVAVDPQENRIYVSNGFSDDLSVIDGGTDSEITRVSVGGGPGGVAINVVTGRVFVANRGDNTVSEIDITTETPTEVEPPISISGTAPVSIEVNQSDNYVYVVNQVTNDVSVIDAATRTEIDTDGNPGNGITPIPVGNWATGAAFNPITKRLYVANPNSNTMSVIDGVSFSVTTVAGFSSPQDTEVDYQRNLVYVTNHTSDQVSVIDGVTNQEIDVDGNGANGTTRIQVGDGPGGLGFNLSTNRIYVGNQIDHTVSVISGATWTPVGDLIPVGPNPGGEVEANFLTNRVYVPTGSDNNVWVIEDMIPVGGIAEYPNVTGTGGGGGYNYAAAAAVAGTALMALGAGTWYARRR